MTHAARRETFAPERIEALPRRLIGRRRCTFLEVFTMNSADRFQVGDMLNFQKPDGTEQWIVIFGIDICGAVEAAFWDGLPQLFETTLDELSCLRVLRVEKMGLADVEMYREWVGLDPRIVN